MLYVVRSMRLTLVRYGVQYGGMWLKLALPGAVGGSAKRPLTRFVYLVKVTYILCAVRSIP